MSTDPEFLVRLSTVAAAVAERLEADIILYNGNIQSPYDDAFITKCRAVSRRPNVLLVLSTEGGSADAAYRMARCLQRCYGRFIVYIPRSCKSAGTLLAVGADEIIMSDLGELGPLDVQLYKPDEVGEMSSGLTMLQALNTLGNKAFDFFEDSFLKLRVKSGLQITTKSAAEIASSMVTGLFGPIYGQVDPSRLGEIDRSVRISMEYGNRIGKKNLKSEALEQLVAGYPSHSFVIDREEAQDLFQNLRKPTEQEEKLAEEAEPVFAALDKDGVTPFVYLEEVLKTLLREEHRQDVEESDVAGRGTEEGKGPGGSTAHREDGAQPIGQDSSLLA